MQTFTKINKCLLGLFCILIIMQLMGCAAMHTSISKQDLVIQTKMSHSIFLEPVAPEQKKVFVQVKNTSGNNILNFQHRVITSLAAKGYEVVDNPREANFLIQANVLRITKANRREVDAAFNAGFSGALIGGTLAAAAGGDDAAIIGLGLAGSMVGLAADAMIKDIYYIIITDLQISERSHLAINEVSIGSTQQGRNSQEIQVSSKENHWKKYQTRIVSTANKVNLKLDEARPILVSELVNSISGVM